MNTPGSTLVLVDGTALMYRAYFAFIRNPLINSRGEQTSASFGVCNSLISIIRELDPDGLAVVFDTAKPTFRHEMYADYKATRQKMPDELRQQVDRVRQGVEMMGLPLLEVEGYEADDVIGTLALQGKAAGKDVVMVTGDKDFMQLVSPGIRMFVPMKNEFVDEAGVKEKFGVEPDRIIDLLALMGDSSDNVPGVPKVGQKTAQQLIEQFSSLDGVLDHADEISKPSIKKAVSENREQALLSQRLVTIKTDVPLEISIDDLSFNGIADETAIPFFREMEFTSLIDSVAQNVPTERPDVTIVTPDTLDEFFTHLATLDEWSIDLETTSTDPMLAEMVGISIAAVDDSWYIPVGHLDGVNCDPTAVYERLNPLLANPGTIKAGHNAKYDAIILKRIGYTVADMSFDTMLAAYVLDPGIRGYSLAALSEKELGHTMQSIKELIGTGKKQRSFAEVDIEAAARYSGDDARVTLELMRIFGPRLEEEKLMSLFTDIEMPLMHVLMDMEIHGVCLDSDALVEISKELGIKLDSLESQIHDLAGEPFNINSPKQLGAILFDKIGLKPVRKSKTGYSTDVDVLTRLAQVHELPALVLDYRQLAKLKSTYADALPQMVNPSTGRIHTSYNQAVAATGRLSSTDPNLQNIPIRTEIGRSIRTAFIAPPGHVLMSADYSQIELRIMAHISEDKVLTDAFLNGEDVHRKTASIMFGVKPEEVTSDQRRQAKTINFGVMYGMGAYALSQQLGISRNDAKSYIDNYFATHTGVRDYMERIIAEAEHDEYVTTLMNRKRYLRDIHSSNRGVAEFARRTAINTPIQGSAADLIKVAMITLHKHLKDEFPDTHMILQVHDELVLEVPERDTDAVETLVRDIMENAITLKVPLIVDIGCGAHWLEAH